MLKFLENNAIKSSTEKQSFCHHRPETKAHSNEYENNTHKAEQSLPAWRGAGRSSRDTKPLLSATVPAAVAFATGLGCCLAEIAKKKNKIACYYAAAVAEIS